MNAAVTFYLLQSGDETRRFQIACRLSEMALAKQHTVYIHLDDSAQMQALDDLLWTYRDISFLPHEIVSNNTSTAPILLGYGDNCLQAGDQLLNLSLTIPAFYTQFKRTLEIVPKTGELKNTLRDHYRLYKEANCDLTTHEVA